MKRENFYRRDPGLALAGMASMGLEERGVYNTVIDLLYLTWRPLEDDRGYIAGHCRCAVQKLNPILNRLIETGKLVRFEEGGRWFISNPKFEEERTDVKGPSATRSGRGKGGATGAQVWEKSAGVEEKSASVGKNSPLLTNDVEEKQPDTALDKSRVDQTSANALFVVADAPTVDPRPKAKKRREYPAAFDAIWGAYPHHEGRSSKPNAVAQWKALPDDERGGLMSAIAAFRPKVAEVCGGKGAPDMARWLKDGKHLAWMDKGAPGLPLPDVTPFPSPGVRQIVVTAKGESWTRTWLDSQCRWDQPTRTIICPRQLTVDRLREAAPELEHKGAKIIVETQITAGRSAA